MVLSLPPRPAAMTPMPDDPAHGRDAPLAHEGMRTVIHHGTRAMVESPDEGPS